VSKFLTLVVSGAVTGAIYSLVAAGLTLSYSATGIFNFSYGAVAFTCAFLYYELNTGLDWSVGASVITTVFVFAPLLGLLLNAAVFRPLARATESAKIMATVGLLIALPALTRFVTDELVNIFHFDIPDSATVLQVGFPSGVGPVPRENWRLPGDIPFDSNQLIVFVTAAVCAFGLWVLLRHTPLGLRMRAVVDRPDLAVTRGVDERMTSRYAWVIGMVLAGLAGVVGAPVLGTLNPSVYIAVVFVASAAAVLGGLRSIPLAFAGGLLLGIAQNLVFGYATFAKDIRGFNASVPFVLLLAGLVVITRDRTRRGGSATEDVPPPDYLADLPPWRRAAPWAAALAVLVAYILFLADSFWLGVVANGLALSLIFLSFVVVTGLGGMVSLAQASLVSASALTAGMLINRYDVPFVPALLIGAAVAALVGVVVALPALRLGGLPLALATLALAFLGDNVLFAWDWLRNGQAGWALRRPSIGPLDLADNRTLALTLLVLIGIVTLLIRNLQVSASGRAIAAVRSSEPAASTSGVSPVRTKLAVFALAATIAGVGGVMLGTFNGSVTNQSTPATAGLLWLATVVLFGIRRPAGAVLAGLMAAAFPVIVQSGFHWPSFVPGWLSWDGTNAPEIPAILFGLGAVQLARSPDGILSIMAAGNRVRRLRRASRVRLAAVREAEIAAVTEDTERREHELEATGALRSHGTPDGQVAAAATDERAALMLRDVHSGYGEIEVLHGIDLTIRAGEITALLGANGSGKSTLCRTISALVPVSKGSIVVDGRDVTGLSSPARARRSVLVAPETRGIFPGLSVEENLALLLRKESERRQAYERFPLLGERRRLPAASLSGGEQQMLTLAPLLVRPPDVLVADEPTLGLAPLVVSELMTVFSELRDRGVALLLVEEKTGVLDIADRVAVFELGRIAWQGPRADVDQEQLTAAYLGAEPAR
jgi:ABC-type branched-subunit amino acid transport system ATPase component/branched-subunit amino acid ABC-type transport system permease component